MPEALSKVYHILSPEEQQQLYDYALFLASKHLHTNQDVEDKLSALQEFAGSMKNMWGDTNPLEYQQGLRGERDRV